MDAEQQRVTAGMERTIERCSEPAGEFLLSY
jgi:hypothetical protein